MRVPEVPNDHYLDVSVFRTLFQHTTNSYKYFWFLSILDRIKEGSSRIRIWDIILGMIQRSWYPVIVYRLSFGSADKLEPFIRHIEYTYRLNPIPGYNLDRYIQNFTPRDDEEINAVRLLKKYVPTRFLSPFFKNELRGLKDHLKENKIRSLADQSFALTSPPFYRFIGEEIQIHPEWFRYFTHHLYVLESYVNWHLVNYLQRRNPGVPAITQKLVPPQSRLLNSARKFWEYALPQLQIPHCIYSDTRLEEVESLDHFLPWSFVGHDLIWNLVPTSKSVNSSKSDNLPDLKYLPSLIEIQYEAMNIACSASKHKKIVQEYTDLLKVRTIDDLADIKKHDFQRVLEDAIISGYRTARNMGFVEGWVYG